jgi:hypothetical protein
MADACGFPLTFPFSLGGCVPTPDVIEIEGTELVWIESHCEQGKELLLSQFRGRPRLEAALCAYLDGVQDLHNAIWQCLTERSLAASVGVQLDALGSIVDLPRQGWEDEAYRRVLRGRILALRSDGSRPALLRIVAALGLDVTLTDVYEYPPAAVVYSLGEPLPGAPDLAAGDVFWLLDYARAAAVRLDLEYPIEALAETFTWADADADQADTLRGWADDGSTLGGYWAEIYTES